MRVNDHFSVNEEKILSKLKQINLTSLSFKTGRQKYFCPRSVKEALILRQKYPKAYLISGATDIALKVTKNHELLSKIIDLSTISALNGLSQNKNGVKIMAGTTLSELISVAKKNFPALFDMLMVFGSEQIRNLATVGGNLATASPIGDIAPILMAYNAKIILLGQKKKRVFAVEDFITGYRKTACHNTEIISAVKIPFPKKNVQIRFYKFSKRKELDISTISGGFRLELSKHKKVKTIKLAFGGLAFKTKRAVKTEKFIVNKEWCENLVVQAGETLEQEFTPISDARASAEGRLLAAKNLMHKFWTDTM
jgi:xanthine dehydrogenase small subunit